MRKIFLFAAAAMLSTALFADQHVADFENIELAEESVLHLSESGTFTSGDFTFQQEVSVSGWGTYYYGNIVTNKTANEYKGDYQNDMSASGGAHSGKNFVVWTGSYVGVDGITLDEAAVIPGFYVNNTPWVVDAILNGDGMSDDDAAPFGENDFFTLTINGFLDGNAVNNEVKVELAKGTSYIKDWTYVDLSGLGTVDALKFTLSSSKKNDYGMTTPAYFAFDDLGVEKTITIATFEDVTIGEPESVLHLAETGTIQSGSFLFTQEVNVSEWGTYYYGNVPTNKTSNEYKGNWQNDMSASGGAYEGANFIVWTSSYSGLDGVSIDHADVVPGFFVNNTPWVVDAILNGDGMSSDGAAPFSAEDYFTLTITATLNGVAVNNEVKVDLAAEGKYINQWTYVDLSALGEVDALHFALSGSKHNDYGLTTPAYFAMDNFGAEMPEGYVAPEQEEIPAEEGIEDTEVAVKAVKVLRNGQLIIVRGEAEFTVMGQSIK